jgi:hypothetical protein
MKTAHGPRETTFQLAKRKCADEEVKSRGREKLMESVERGEDVSLQSWRIESGTTKQQEEE